MKPNRFWLHTVALAALLALGLWGKRHAFGTKAPQIAHPLAGAESLAPSSMKAANQGALSSGPSPSAVPSRAADDARRLEAHRRVADQSNVPIDFHGRVIDQNSNPVPGVVIKAVVRHWAVATLNTPPPDLSPYSLQRIAATDGSFEISGVTGDGFDLDFGGKDGYELSPRTLRSYGPSGTSFENPAIFRMWRKGAPQSLVRHYISRVAIPVDGQPVQFDLFDGRKVASGGQLVVRVARSPQILPAGHGAYDWSATLEIPSGGLVTSTDEFMYQAPESGYQPAHTVEMASSATNWTSTLNQQFYIECEGGKYYGSLGVDMPTFHSPPPIVLSLSVTLNPNGSRNLQP